MAPSCSRSPRRTLRTRPRSAACCSTSRMPKSVRDGFAELMQRAAARAPTARIEGVLSRPTLLGGVETILGVKRDPVFGPVIMFGLGRHLRGSAEGRRPAARAHRQARGARHDRRRSRAARSSKACAGKQPCDTDALADALVNLSQFAAAQADDIESIDINPFLVLPRGRGGYALDALVALVQHALEHVDRTELAGLEIERQRLLAGSRPPSIVLALRTVRPPGRGCAAPRPPHLRSRRRRSRSGGRRARAIRRRSDPAAARPFAPSAGGRSEPGSRRRLPAAPPS